MKKNFFLSAVLIFSLAVFLTSCASVKKSEEHEKKSPAAGEKYSDSYKLIEQTENFDYLTAKICFPEFENNETLNKQIRNSILSDYNNFKNFAKVSWTEINGLNSENTLPHYAFIAEPEIFGDKKTISVLIKNYVYSGGAHGNTTLKSYNFNKETGKFFKITEVLNLSYDELSKKCREKLSKSLVTDNIYIKTPSDENLMYSMINDGASAQAGNFEIFTVSKNFVTVYFEPYAVAPYSYGIQKVEIKKE